MNHPHLPPLLENPAIDRIGHRRPGPDPLRDYLAHGTRPWGGVPVPLSGPVTGALWTILFANLVVAGWLIAVLHGAAACSGPVCTIATWGHPIAVLTITTSSVAALTGAALVTRGLSEARSFPLAIVVLGAVSGVIGTSGLIALTVAVLGATTVAIVVLLTVIERV
jgi:hypothetical protein